VRGFADKLSSIKLIAITVYSQTIKRMNRATIRQLLCVFTTFFFLVGAVTSAEAARKSRAKAHKPLYAGATGMAKDWEPNLELKPYKQNYLLLYARTEPVNNSPTSPNLQNQILTPYNLDNRDVKFQVSVKHDLIDLRQFGALWFAYTQQVFWQYHDNGNSRPMREVNYEPEFIYSIRPSSFSLLNFGVVHQSNGESKPRSRAWDRAYVQTGLELDGGGEFRAVLMGRWWKRYAENPASDDNADIADYMGYRELELRLLQQGGWEISALGRSKAVKIDIAAPISSWLFLGTTDEPHINIHAQYFRGYGESLLDYNHFHTAWGFGFSFPMD